MAPPTASENGSESGCRRRHRRPNVAKANYRLQWQHFEAIDVEVNPHEFTTFCDATGAQRTNDSLDNLAVEKGLRKQDR
jgi:hypothetical protein